jgi:signal transduction histidine kinase
MRTFARLRWRVLAHGFAVMLIMSAAIAIADRLFVNAWMHRELAQRHTHRTNFASVYGAEGALLASNVEPSVPAPSPETWARLSTSHEPVVQDDLIMSGIFHADAFAGVLVRRLPPPMEEYPGPPLPVILLAFVACMAATLVLSVPLARSVVHPVEALARSVEQFGSGKLSTRVGLHRHDEIGELAAAFDEMATRVEALVRSEKRLLANVSHELRTPLARIRVVLELASDGDPGRIQSYLAEIAHDLAELESLVDDVLASARIDAAAGRLGDGNLPLHWTTVNLATLVEKSRARFASLYPERELAVVIEGDLSELRCDPALLRRVVDNLLDNAVQHGKGAPIELRAGGDSDSAFIEVTDWGPGMSAEAAAHAFDPFYRADDSRDRRNGGVGLGLSIIRGVVEAHGGSVELDTEPGRGTSVTARIPRRSGGSDGRAGDPR